MLADGTVFQIAPPTPNLETDPSFIVHLLLPIPLTLDVDNEVPKSRRLTLFCFNLACYEMGRTLRDAERCD
jgi:hypothetical protein